MKETKTPIVITSINHPTESVRAFAEMKDYQLFLVADRKTPDGWSCPNVIYLSVAEQKKMGYQLARLLPDDHYCRKMLGYLEAVKNRPASIVDTDDDNIPKAGWDFPAFDGHHESIKGNLGFVNVYQLYTRHKIWPRGLPLNLINDSLDLKGHMSSKDSRVGIWQGLADGDPDVDAIYRLTDDTDCYFTDRPPVILEEGAISPFNSQNTIIRKELFALLYLPVYVTFRFTDILRSLIAQPIMWLYGYELGFTNATVVQKRNPHNYMEDFASEIPMYCYTEKVIELVSKAISPKDSLESNLYNAYNSLLTSGTGIILDQEMKTLEAWLKDLEALEKL